MKLKESFLPLLTILTPMILAGCKYEDGPFISLRSKKERLVN